MNSIKNGLIFTAMGFATLFAGAASAQIQLTAFAEAAAFEYLLDGDVIAAKKEFSELSLESMDYLEANNYCVAMILEKDYTAAVASCEAALEKVEDEVLLGLSTRRKAANQIDSNLEAAKELAGEMFAAN